ncbi:MAG: hypothetical protein Q8O87_00095 [bacterium]|nr:hypothetical protein [bacterium]
MADSDDRLRHLVGLTHWCRNCHQPSRVEDDKISIDGNRPADDHSIAKWILIFCEHCGATTRLNTF